MATMTMSSEGGLLSMLNESHPTYLDLNFCTNHVSEVSSILDRAAGLGKAVYVLDTLGSSMNNLNLSSGFESGMATKGIKISILAFEIANTIVKRFKSHEFTFGRERKIFKGRGA